MTKERGNFNLIKGTSDEKTKPGREVEFGEDKVNPGVLDGIEGFSGVEEKEVAFGVVFYAVEEESVHIDYMFVAVAAIKETFLGRVSEI